MKLSERESWLALFAAAVVLFGGAFFLLRPRVYAWREVLSAQATVRAEIADSQALIAERPEWEKRLAAVEALVPRIPAEKNTVVHWLSTMDALAARNNVSIFKRQAGEEKQSGDIYELPIECQDWEATLDSVVHFLFELQSEGAMFDVRQVMMKPKAGDRLKGRFLLYCAYTRGTVEQAQQQQSAAE